MRYHFTAFYFLLILVCSPCTYADQKKSSVDYWKESGLSYQDLRGFVQERTCYKNADVFAACINTLSNFLTMMKSTYKLSPWPSTEPYPLIRSFGPIAMVKTSDSPNPEQVSDSPRVQWMKIKEKRDRRQSELRQLFARTQDNPINFEEIVDFVQRFATKDPAEAAMTATEINYFLSATVDPHTHINPTAEFAAQSQSSGEELTGIGAYLGWNKSHQIILAPIEGSPALDAGIHYNDILLKINGASVDGLELDAISDRLRGTSGSIVTLTVLRKEKSLTISIQRRQVKFANVTSRLMNDGGSPTGYIRMGSFMSKLTCGEVEQAVHNLEAQGAKSLILDLRNNGGGLLDQAVCIGGLFVGPNVIVQVKNLAENDLQPTAASNPAVTKLPMITLINAGSASASEVLAGALQDYRRSWIAGQRSFGKATVQGGIQVSEGILMFKTIARFYQPSGRTNQVVGIVPNFPLDPVPNATEDDRFALREADLYENALPPVGRTWTEPDPTRVAALNACMQKNGKAEQIFEAKKDDALAPDYQLIQAEVLAACDLQTAH